MIFAGDYSGGGGGGGGSSSNYDSGSGSGNGRKGYEEYNAGDWEDSPRRSNSLSGGRTPTNRQPSTSASAIGRRQLREETAKETAKETASKQKEKVLDIFGDDAWGDEPTPAVPAIPAVPSKIPAVAQAPVGE